MGKYCKTPIAVIQFTNMGQLRRLLKCYEQETASMDGGVKQRTF